MACVLLAGAHGAGSASLALSGTSPSPGTTNAPVNFVADQITYDKTGNIITADRPCPRLAKRPDACMPTRSR